MQEYAVATQIAGEADREAVVELLVQTDRHYWDEREGAEAAADRTAEAILGGVSGCRMLLAYIDGAPMGYATFTLLHPAPSEHGTLFLKDLFVAESARGKQVGELIMRRLAAMAVMHGCQRFDWTAETDNPGALAFYDRLQAPRVAEKVYYRFSGGDLARFASPDTPEDTEAQASP